MLKEIRNRLKGMLSWSDRIGSDEIGEINGIIKLIDKLPDYKVGYKKKSKLSKKIKIKR